MTTLRVLMNFMLRDGWSVHFIEEDCRTPLGTIDAIIPALESSS